MKHTFSITLLSALFLTTLYLMGSSTETFNKAEMVTVKLHCKNMVCEGCKQKITGSIMDLKGIQKVDVNLKTKIIEVIYDDSIVTVEQIIKAVEEAGYEAKKVS